VVVGLLAAGCSGNPATDSTVTSTTAAPADSTTTLPPDATTTTSGRIGVSTEFGRAVIELDGVPLTVAVADTNDERSRGLMGVEELSPLDGMLFVFDTESVRSFWMKDTLIPLDIAFFGRDGFLVSQTTMTTCLDGDCPSYSSVDAAQYALEAPAGSLANLPEDARLVIIGALDGSGKEI
jgi:uncharacterized membrane protein (UPF0127 family)